MGCINFNSNEEEEDEIEDNTPGLTQVYFDESLAKPKINSNIIISITNGKHSDKFRPRFC